MGKDRSQYVLSLLENYPQMAREIELMRYELQFSIGISAQEMIEVMSFAKKDGESKSDYPHSVPGIAACYKDVAKRLNREITESMLDKYISLLREQDRLHHYIGLLLPRQAELIREYYICRHSWSEVSKNMGISLRTAYAVRQQAVDALSCMYAFTDSVLAPDKTESDPHTGKAGS